MNSPTEIKNAVKTRYGQIAKGELIVGESAVSSCCGSGCGCSSDESTFVDMSLQYSETERQAIPDGADLGLGCGTPVAFAGIKPGMTVLDLGSGAGIDCFVAARSVGPNGKVIGVDMTEEMIERANENKQKVGITNVEFRLGEIEALPVESDSVDRIISNCVINLVPSKENAFREIHRVLKPQGKFIISDIVIDGIVTEAERKDASLWAGCISGAIDRNEYLSVIKGIGFRDVQILSEKRYDYTLSSGTGMFSITVTATK